MKIVLDLQTLQSESRHRGIGSYTRGLARQLLIDHTDIEWHALLNGAMPDHLAEARQWLGEWLAPERIHVFSGLSPTSGLDSLNEPRARASGCLRDRFLESLRPDLVLTMSPFDGFGDNTVVGQSTIRPAFVEMAIAYDFIPFQYPELYLATAQIEHWFRARLDRLRQADHVLAISEYTAKVAVEAFEFPPDRVTAIGTDANPLYRRLADHEIDAPRIKRAYGIQRTFFLHVGILERRKNVPLLVRAFARLSPDLQARYQLVLVAEATEAQKSELLNLARELGITPDSLVFAGHVPSEDLVRLYHLAEASFMPSRAEGFGLPLLEAMRCGSPAFGARATSLPEVVGEDAFLFDPEQPQECARLMERIVTEPAFRTLARDHAVARSKAFGWASTAEKTVELCRKLVAQASSRPEISPKSSTASAVPVKSPPLRFFKSLFGKQTSASIRHNARNESGDGLESMGVPVRTLDLDQNDNRDSWIDALDGPVFLRLKGTASLTWAKLSARERYRILGYRAKAHSIGADEPLSLAEIANAFGPLILGVIRNKEGDLWEGATADGALFTSNGAEASNDILENMAVRSPMAPTRLLADDVRLIDGLHLADRIAIAEAAGKNHRPLASQPRLLVDVTHLAQFDAKSGIQRVVRNILNGLMARPLHYRVEPIYREGGRYWFAREFGARFFGIPNPGLGETNVDFRPDDVFLGLDLDAAIDEAGVQTLVEAHTRGMRIVLVVYDILPIRRPEWFDRGMSAAFKTWLAYLSRYADGLACISQATADDVRDYLTAKGNGFH
ncbi:MAG: glycosyltransferase, partial [Rhabdaerophilum sp.]